MSQITHIWGVKFLAWKSGSVKFWKNIMSVQKVLAGKREPKYRACVFLKLHIFLVKFMVIWKPVRKFCSVPWGRKLWCVKFYEAWNLNPQKLLWNIMKSGNVTFLHIKTAEIHNSLKSRMPFSKWINWSIPPKNSTWNSQDWSVIFETQSVIFVAKRFTGVLHNLFSTFPWSIAVSV